MEVLYVVYGAFSDTIDTRRYFDLVIAREGIVVINIGSLPIVYKHRAALPRNVELMLLRLAKASSRKSYDEVSIRKLIERRKAFFIGQEDIVVCTLKEREIPIPPILRKPPGDPRKKPKYTEQVLEISVYTPRDIYKFYTTLKLKDPLKKALKEAGMYLPSPIIED